MRPFPGVGEENWAHVTSGKGNVTSYEHFRALYSAQIGNIAKVRAKSCCAPLGARTLAARRPDRAEHRIASVSLATEAARESSGRVIAVHDSTPPDDGD